MPHFKYKGITETGEQVSGQIEAESLDAANMILLNRGYIPGEVKEISGKSGDKVSIFQRMATVKAPELILFTKQFRTLLKAGVPIVKLLEILEQQAENPKLKGILSIMAKDIREGASLFDAFKKHPGTFSNLYCSMVRAGEVSGALPDVLERLTYIIEHEHKIRSDLKAALQYPIIVVVFLGIAFFILLTFVIPKFATIFLAAGIDLPMPTRVCIALYNLLKAYWYIIVAGVFGGLFAAIFYFRTEQGKYVLHTALMRIPIIGPLIIKTVMSRFASIFAILQASGVAILDAMHILSGTIGNAAVSREFDRLREQLKEGKGIAGPLSSAKFFPPMVINMVAIGEESGNLDEMLREVAVHYDTEVQYSVDKLSQAIGPVLIVGLAAVVGFFATAIFLPMWDMTKMVR